MADHVLKKTQSRWLRLLSFRWLRLAVLILIGMLELLLVWALRTQGWLETIDWGWQILIVMVVFSPLIAGLCVLFGKRFRLSSLLIAFSLLAVFMALGMLPVYEEVRARAAMQSLANLGAAASNATQFYSTDLENRELVRKPYKLEVILPAGWIVRLAPTRMKTLRSAEVAELGIFDDQQFEHLAKTIREFPNLKHVSIWYEVTANTLNAHAKSLLGSSVRSIAMRSYNRTTECDLSWLNGNDSIENLQLFDQGGMMNEIAASENLHLKGLLFRQMEPQSEAEFRSFFASPTVNQLEVLSLQGQKHQSIHISPLENLRRLELNSFDVADFRFLSEMKQLRVLYLGSMPLVRDDFDQILKATQLEHLTIYRSSGMTPEIESELKLNLPDCTIKIYN